MPYYILDNVCKAYIEDYVQSIEDFKIWMDDRNITIKECDINILNERYSKMVERIDRFEFKRRLSAFCIKIGKKSFGSGRRIPICKG